MRVGTLLAGLVFILVGLVLFLANLGYVSPEFIRQLLRFWPILLIIFGLGLFWGGKIPRFFAFMLVIIAIAGVLALAFLVPGPMPVPRGEVHTDLRVERENYPDLETGHLSLHFGGGRLFLNGKTEHWFAGNFRGPSETVPSYDVQNRKILLNFKERRVSLPARNMINIWHLHLSPDLKWDLEVESGAVDGELDLEGLPLQNIKIKVGAGNLTVRLGNNGEDVKGRVEAGASNLKIMVTEDTGFDIGYQGVLANTNLKELGWSEVDGRYRSPLYDRATSRVTLDFDMAVGNLNVEVIPVQR